MIEEKEIDVKSKYVMYLVMLVVVYFVFFQQLDSFQIRTWDESTYAVNAYEMHQNGNYITPHLKGVADNTWNTMPPLLIWCQVAFIKALGFNELAIRLPSAIASALTGFLLFVFMRNRFSFLLAFICFLVYCSSMGVSTFHTGRTGDTDALFTFFLIGAIFEFYKWLHELKEKSILYFFIFLTLAYLTKGIAVVSILPAILILGIIEKRINSLFKNKFFYEGKLLFLVFVTGYIFLRNSTGSYIEGIVSNELNKVIASNQNAESFDFYFNNLYTGQFAWILFVIPGIILMYKNSNLKSLLFYFGLLFASHICIYSFSTEKLFWYMLPLLPILSVFSAVTLFELIKVMQPSMQMKKALPYVLLIVLVPIYFAARQSYKSDLPEGKVKDEALARYAFKNKNSDKLNGTMFFTTNFDLPLVCYQYMQNEKGFDFKIRNNINYISPKEDVIVSEEALIQELKTRFNLELLEEEGFIKRFRLTIKQTEL